MSLITQLTGTNNPDKQASVNWGNSVYHFITREKCTPLEYGAAGDGSTDDVAAIQLALNSRKRVRIPTGFNFNTTGTIVLPSGGQIEGDGGTITWAAGTGGARLFHLGSENGDESAEQMSIEGVDFACSVDRGFIALVYCRGLTGTLLDNFRFRYNSILYNPATLVDSGDRWIITPSGSGTRSNFDVSHNIVNGRMQLVAAGAHTGTAEDWLVSYNTALNSGQSAIAFSIADDAGGANLGLPCTIRRVRIINNSIQADGTVTGVSRAIFAGIDGSLSDQNGNIYDLLVADNDIDILDAGAGTIGIHLRLGNLCSNIGGFNSENKRIILDNNRCRAGTYLQIQQETPVTASGLSEIEGFVLRDTRDANNDVGTAQTFLRHLANDARLIGNNLANANILLGADNGRIVSTANQYGLIRTSGAAEFNLKSRNDTIGGAIADPVILDTSVAGQTAEFVNPTINSNHATPTVAIETKGAGAPAVNVYGLTTSTTWSTGKFVATTGTITDKTTAAAVADLNQTISATPTQAEVQAISDKIDALLASLRAAGKLAS